MAGRFDQCQCMTQTASAEGAQLVIVCSDCGAVRTMDRSEYRHLDPDVCPSCGEVGWHELHPMAVDVAWSRSHGTP